MPKNVDDSMRGCQQRIALRRNRVHEQDDENMKPAGDVRQAMYNGALKQVKRASKRRRLGRKSETTKTQRMWSGGSGRGGGAGQRQRMNDTVMAESPLKGMSESIACTSRTSRAEHQEPTRGKFTTIKHNSSRPVISKRERDSADCLSLYGPLGHHKRNKVKGRGRTGGLRRAPKDQSR